MLVLDLGRPNKVGSLRRNAAVAKLLAARSNQPFGTIRDLMWRARLSIPEGRLLALAGALNFLAEHRRAALWQMESTDNGDELFHFAPADEEALSPLARMTHLERLQADYATLGLTVGQHPMALVRAYLHDVTTAAGLKEVRHGTRVKVAGSVITRQRPGTAKGFCFVTLEDETGHANTIVRPALFEECRQTINMEPSMEITGKVQNESGVIHVMAELIRPLAGFQITTHGSHDYR